MEFNCEKKALQTGVQVVERIVATRSTLPIIGNILFEVNKGGLKLSANNLEIGVELNVKAKVEKEGSFLLPAKTLSSLVAKLPDGTVGCRTLDNNMVRINYGSSHFNLHSLPPDEFPMLPKVKEGKSFVVETATMEAMIRQTFFAASASEDKYVLTGVLLEYGKSSLAGDTSNIRLVATDGYRLAKRAEKIKGVEGAGGAIVPVKALQELIRIMESKEEEEVKINISADQISFRYGDAYLVSRLIQGQFPDYKQVIPKRSGTKATLQTKEFLQAAERVAVIASGSANVSVFEVKNDKLHLSASTPDVGNVDEALSAEIKGGDKTRASFNIRLITDALAVLESEKVTLELGEGLSPGVLKPESGEDYLYIVMPIRTQEGL